MPSGINFLRAISVLILLLSVEARSSGFPSGGRDTMNSRLTIDTLRLGNIQLTNVQFTGTIIVQRSNPISGIDGYSTILTEMIFMNLNGSVNNAPATITLDGPKTLGWVTAKQAYQDFPAKSLFEVFAKIVISAPINQVLYTYDPVHPERGGAILRADTITQLPPYTMNLSGNQNKYKNPFKQTFGNSGMTLGQLMGVTHEPNYNRMVNALPGDSLRQESPSPLPVEWIGSFVVIILLLLGWCVFRKRGVRSS